MAVPIFHFTGESRQPSSHLLYFQLNLANFGMIIRLFRFHFLHNHHALLQLHRFILLLIRDNLVSLLQLKYLVGRLYVKFVTIHNRLLQPQIPILFFNQLKLYRFVRLSPPDTSSELSLNGRIILIGSVVLVTQTLGFIRDSLELVQHVLETLLETLVVIC